MVLRPAARGLGNPSTAEEFVANLAEQVPDRYRAHEPLMPPGGDCDFKASSKRRRFQFRIGGSIARSESGRGFF